MAIALASITLVIHLVNLADVPPPVLRAAQTVAAGMLRDIGVTIEWAPESAPAPAGADAVHLTLLPYEVGSLRSRDGVVFGSAMRTALGAGSAWVYYQRVLTEAARHNMPASRLLACAIAHEIGHLVQASPGHDDQGIMRAIWTAPDFRRASKGQLRFNSAGPPSR